MSKVCKAKTCTREGKCMCIECKDFFCEVHSYNSEEWNEGDKHDIKENEFFCLWCGNKKIKEQSDKNM